MTAEFTITGKPVPKARPRFDTRHGRVYTPAKSVKYEKRVAGAAHNGSRWERLEGGHMRRRLQRWPEPDGCARAAPRRPKRVKCVCPWCSFEYRIELDIYLPDRRTRDLDNIEKAVLDGMTGVLWHDDRQVYVARKDKDLSRLKPRVDVRIRQVIIQGELGPPKPELEDTEGPCPDCEGSGALVVLTLTGAQKRVNCGLCQGTGHA